MIAWRLCCALLLSLASMMFLPSPSSATPKPVRLFKQSAHQLGGPTVTADWAGVWTVSDTIKLCDIPIPLFIQTHTDTMCVGDVITGDETVPYSCSGTVTATTVDMTCTGSSDDGNGCAGSYTQVLHGTRSGNTATMHYRITITFAPPGCDTDGCLEQSILMTRTAGPPATCSTTPTLKTTWGKLKRRYR